MKRKVGKREIVLFWKDPLQLGMKTSNFLTSKWLKVNKREYENNPDNEIIGLKIVQNEIWNCVSIYVVKVKML